MPRSLAIDTETLKCLDDLPLLAKSLMEGFISGLHRSPFLGYSSEFASYRPYIQGDELRHVDWKVWGRTDALYVKQFEDHTNLNCQLLLDTSASMDFGTGAANKFDFARLLAAVLVHLSARQQDAPGLVLYGDNPLRALPARGGRQNVDDLFQWLIQAEATGRSANDDELVRWIDTWTRRGLVVVLSDLLGPLEIELARLSRLRQHRQEVIVFHLLAPEECDLPYEADLLMEDSETGELVPVDAIDAREGYRERMEHFFRQIQDECLRLEIDYHRIRTDTVVERALLAYLEKRSRC